MPRTSIACSYTATARQLPISIDVESAHRKSSITMRIGYAPGACLRGWLMQLGHSLAALSQAGLVTSAGYDAYVHRIVFPLEDNLYGRSISDSARLTGSCLEVKAACIAGMKFAVGGK
jgi:hypothetical protein